MHWMFQTLQAIAGLCAVLAALGSALAAWLSFRFARAIGASNRFVTNSPSRVGATSSATLDASLGCSLTQTDGEPSVRATYPSGAREGGRPADREQCKPVSQYARQASTLLKVALR